MKIAICALVASSFAVSIAHAAPINLTDEVFVAGSVTYASANPINGFQEESDGVTFTFATTGQFRNVGTWNTGSVTPANPALTFGGGGGNTATFTLSSSTDVTLDSFVGLGALHLYSAIFDVSGTGVSSVGNVFSTQGFLSTGSPVSESFIGGALSLSAGEIYTFSVTNPGAQTLSHLTGFEFTKVTGTDPVSSVPLPAGLPLLLSALAGFGLIRRRNAT